MTHQEEQYAHFWHCINDLNKALSLLQAVKINMDNPLRAPAFELALIVYSKPYKQSCGITKKNHKLDDKYVPDKHRDLHKRILANRDQILAHTDLIPREPKVHVGNASYGKIVGLSENVINILAEFGNIDSIIELIEQSLDGMHEEEKKLAASLPTNMP